MRLLTQKQLEQNYVPIPNPVPDFFVRRQSIHLNNGLLYAYLALKEGDTTEAVKHLVVALWMLGVIDPPTEWNNL